jgi:hypothetical protein
MATEIAGGHGIHGNLHSMAEATRGGQSVIEEFEMMETEDRRDLGKGKEIGGNGRKNIRGNRRKKEARRDLEILSLRWMEDSRR